LRYFLYKDEYGALKHAEVIVRKGWGGRENNRGDEPKWGTTYVYKEMKPPV
jgi:hypothetical protein